MKYLLDSNICVHIFRGNEKVKNIFFSKPYSEFRISEIVFTELLYGAYCSANFEKHYTQILDFISEVEVLPISPSLKLFAENKALLKKVGTPIEDFDLLIACTALEYNLIMVTENTKHFERIADIKLENWNQ